MKIINFRKDGSVIEDLRKVTVPKKIVENVRDIAERKTKIRRNGQNGNTDTSRAV